jgi:hypothetical protein
MRRMTVRVAGLIDKHGKCSLKHTLSGPNHSFVRSETIFCQLQPYS